MLASEDVTLRTFTSHHDENPRMIDDKFFRDNSFRQEENNVTSRVEYRIPEEIQKIELHLKNNFEVNG